MNGAPTQIGKVLIVAGIMLVLVGLLLMAGSRLPFPGLGKLPGDVGYKGKHVTLYFPIVTCIILSVVLTLVLWLISFFGRR
jgi:uncharacterized membrane protein